MPMRIVCKKQWKGMKCNMKKNAITWSIFVAVILFIIIFAVVYAVSNQDDGGAGTTVNEEDSQPSNTVTTESGEASINVMGGGTFTIEPENLTLIQ